MPYGVIVRDGAGGPVLDLYDRITRVLGIVDLPGGTDFYEGQLTHGALASGTPWYATTDFTTGAGGSSYIGFFAPSIIISGTTLYWRRPNNLANQFIARTKLIYGVY
ncbi:hypothetical protein LG71_26470 [Pluralibacter gergoviae]|nr:hypothetical protein LG71_26470 [Pluralibacter gergoviae]